MTTPPKQVQLVKELFPKEPWASSLVAALNQFSVQVVETFRATATRYKVLTFSTGADPATSFPIDVPVDEPPSDVRVAMVLSGAPSGPVTVLAQPLSGGKLLRVSSITGLAANSTYSIRLALD